MTDTEKNIKELEQLRKQLAEMQAAFISTLHKIDEKLDATTLTVAPAASIKMMKPRPLTRKQRMLKYL